MADGRTPTLTLVGATYTVTMVDERSAYPFPALSLSRVYEERRTRQASTGAGKTVRVFRGYEGAEQELQFSATLTASDAEKILAMVRANPPAVTVTYLESSSWSGVLVEYSMTPDELGPHDEDGPTEYQVAGRILRDSA